MFKYIFLFFITLTLSGCFHALNTPQRNISDAQTKMREFHQIVLKDTQKARAKNLAQEACQLGLGEGCIFSVFSGSFDATQDPAFIKEELHKIEQEQIKMDRKALLLSTKNCQLDIANECAILAGIYERGDGVNPDPQKAHKLYQKACELDSAQGCLEFNRMQEAKGQYDTDTFNKMISLLQKECDANDPFLCYMLGEWSIIQAMRSSDLSFRSSKLQSTKKFYEKACMLGFNPSAFGLDSNCQENNVWQIRMDIITKEKGLPQPPRDSKITKP